jgi:hypothetical protein
VSRQPQEIRAALATAGGRTVAAPAEGTTSARTWRDVLFQPDGTFSRPSDPDRALLDALTREYSELDRHGDGLPARGHVDWLERILAIPRLPVVPDRVIAHATVDPKVTPVVIPKGTLLRGGKDAAGAERRYRTSDTLTAHGATVLAVRSIVPGGDDAGLPGLIAEAEPFPLTPDDGTDAPHTLRLHSHVLAFDATEDGGTMEVEVTFVGATSSAVAALQQAVWRHPRLDGSVASTVTGTSSGPRVTIVLAESCGVEEGLPWLEVSIPPHRPLPTTLKFTAVKVRVKARSSFVPQAAYFNDGLVDVHKEFQPFGAVAKRGDALYVRSDEAFAKPLDQLTVSVQMMPSGDGGDVLTAVGGFHSMATTMHSGLTAIQNYYATQGTEQPVQVQQAVFTLQGLLGGPVTPSVRWQRRADGAWTTFKDSGETLSGFTGATVPGGVASEKTVVGGESGHLIRAFLAAGDFGWTAYQKAVADFATEAVAPGTTPTMPVPPEPPVVSRLTISYSTPLVTAEQVEAVNGWARVRMDGPGAFTPFTRTISASGDTGMVALGLELPARASGASVSVHLAVDSAASCGSTVDPEAHWEWWDGSGWQELPVADGTRLLRESGLLRFVAPLGWAEGCSDVDTASGRWIRLVTRAPERLGTVTAVMPDAVTASFVSSAPDPQTDTSPATALPPGTIKGTLTPIPGIKKVTNLASVRGRGPEDDRAYRRRASAQARHRGRAVTAWDFEEIVSVEFPEVAAVLCLPHTAADGSRSPGRVGLVVVPDQPLEPAPRPSVSLAGRITDTLAPRTALHAVPTILCAEYVPVTVEVTILLRPGIAALTGTNAVTAALERWLHPTGTAPTRWGRSLYRSSLEAFLDGLPEVDAVEHLLMRGPGAPAEVLEVDVCRGLYCSSGDHLIDVEEQL